MTCSYLETLLTTSNVFLCKYAVVGAPAALSCQLNPRRKAERGGLDHHLFRSFNYL